MVVSYVSYLACLNHCMKNELCCSDGSTAKIHYAVKDCSGSQRTAQDLPVTVNAAGLLTSAAFTGQACLLITSHEDFAVNQSIVVLVKVSVPKVCDNRYCEGFIALITNFNRN